MKRNLFLVGFFFFTFLSTGFSQQHPKVIDSERRGVGDFTIIDSEGNSHNLYNLLDDGKTVLLDLFTAT